MFCTTENEMAPIEEAMTAGAQEYIMKPFDRRSSAQVRAGRPALTDASTAPGRPQPPAAGRDPSRVMVVDDFAVIRGLLSRDAGERSGRAGRRAVGNGQMAIDELKRTPVDVLVLDIEMPVMDGMTALPLLLRADPGAQGHHGLDPDHARRRHRLRALRLGAADYVPKPTRPAERRREFRARTDGQGQGPGPAPRRSRRDCPAGAAAARARRSRPAADRARPACRRRSSPSAVPPAGRRRCSTLVQGLARRLNAPVVLTQHMPATFTPILAEHITALGGMPCAEAKDGEALAAGRIYLAPGDRHLMVDRGARPVCMRV